MRKRRAIIFDDNDLLLSVLKEYFMLRGYEVLTTDDPVACPVCDNNSVCADKSCADVIITDFNMPNMNGIERLKVQSQRGCKVPAGNKMLMSGYIDESRLMDLKELGSVFLEKPFTLENLSAWLNEREPLMDLSRPLSAMRRDTRYESREEVTCLTSPDQNYLKGFVVNRSPSGICLDVDAPLKRDLPVTIRPDEQGATRSALVRWVKEIECGHYQAGLNFL